MGTRMAADIFSYPVIIKENHLDAFGHVNNAVYLSLFEEARWDFLNRNDYGLNKIQALGLGPVILEAHIKYQQELKARDEIIIETQLLSYEQKIGRLSQQMMKEQIVCSTAEFVFALFDIQARKIVLPTHEWLKAIGAAIIP